jgi:hypothetical protein
LKFVDEIYHKDYPSFDLNKNRTKVLVTVFVEYIDKIDEILMSFSVKIHIKLEWFDSRLVFNNLRDEMNLVDSAIQQRLWIPKLVFSNSLPLFQIANDADSVAKIKKEGIPLPRDKNDLHENNLYSGSSNPVSLERNIDLNLRCNFDFFFYPFDHQSCSIMVKSFFNRIYLIHKCIDPV